MDPHREHPEVGRPYIRWAWQLPHFRFGSVPRDSGIDRFRDWLLGFGGLGVLGLGMVAFGFRC